MKVYESVYTTLLILQVVTTRSQMVSFTRRPLYPEDRTSGTHRIVERLSKRQRHDTHRDSSRDGKVSNIEAYVSKTHYFLFWYYKDLDVNSASFIYSFTHAHKAELRKAYHSK